LEQVAKEHNVPIIPHETALFMRLLLRLINPSKILEIGTAYGFSATLFAKFTKEDCRIDTIERFPVMIEKASQVFSQVKSGGKINLIAGDAIDILPKLVENNLKTENKYDFIFLDCAKAQYVKYIPFCLKILAKNGVIAIDDIFQGGSVFDKPEEVKYRQRKIYQGLNQLFSEIYNNQNLEVSSLPLGDGLMIIQAV
ncbi:MAG: O-methyltransferase, partial [Candidatus Ancillula sp.]|jgi:predicted O-methyltransferase YrrM|nr:O-methyltransferase [Candidatus Ancillula sp.]